ncbi:MAG: hypothetical protein ABW185_25160 [Sedimenticola sp.]
MINAYIAVKDDGIAVRKAAKIYCVPEATLRNRVNGSVHIDTVRSGAAPLLSQEEEVRLVDHVTLLAKVGYGYTRMELCNLATEYATDVGKRDRDHPLTLQWYRRFVKRWPTLAVKKPRSLAIARAKATSEENVSNYFVELQKILVKYNLTDKPQYIYNVDEKGISDNHTPPMIVTDRKSTPVAVTSGMSYNVTVIGAGNALGTPIPAFFIFPGKRMRTELLEGATPGVAGTVSDNGWSNGAIFKDYLQNHFLKFVQGRDTTQPLLVLYDGHRSHVSIDLIEWANNENIILFVLSPHTSHVLQPLDVGCFGPFQRIYNDMRHKLMRANKSSSVPKHALCELACKAYMLSITQANLRASFRKSGIYPFNPAEVDSDTFLPATVFQSRENTTRNQTTPTTSTDDASPVHPATDAAIPEQLPTPSDATQPATDAAIPDQLPTPSSPISHAAEFFRVIETNVLDKSGSGKKRKVLTAVVGGKPITEDTITKKIKEHIAGQSTKKTKKTSTKQKPNKTTRRATPPKKDNATKKGRSMKQTAEHHSQVAGASGLQIIPISGHESDLSTIESQEGDPCCVCKQWQPDELRRSAYVEFTKWGECCVPGCGHWVHLKYCTDVTVLRRSDVFNCPCHPGLPSKCQLDD